MFQLYGLSWFFRPGGLVHRSWREFLIYNLVFAFGYNFRNDKRYYLFSFTQVGKNKSISSTRGLYVLTLNCKKKIVWVKIHIFFVITCFRVNIMQSFQGSNFVHFCILKFVIYGNSNSPDTILSVNFCLFGENFVTSFI